MTIRLQVRAAGWPRAFTIRIHEDSRQQQALGSVRMLKGCLVIGSCSVQSLAPGWKGLHSLPSAWTYAIPSGEIP